MAIKYYIRTTGERKLDNSYSQIEYELLIDKDHKPVDSFIKQLELISNEDSVLLEDDLELCKNFKEEIEKVISEHPNDIINFYTVPNKYFRSEYSNVFVYNQCTYYPKGIGKIVANEMTNVRQKYKESAYDTLENKALRNLNILVYNYRPCLVQHLDHFSLITRSIVLINSRITPYYKDYLDKLNIDYNDEDLVSIYLNALNIERNKTINKMKGIKEL